MSYKPLRKAGRELLYLSMLRDSDTKPSFAVNDTLNVWYDHGTGKGGNLIDFGIAYWQLNFKSTLKKIIEVIGEDFSAPEPRKTEKCRHAVKLPHYHIEVIIDLGQTDDISAYLMETRRIERRPRPVQRDSSLHGRRTKKAHTLLCRRLADLSVFVDVWRQEAGFFAQLKNCIL